MRFYGRKEELELLRRLEGGFRVVVVGRRQVGKTRLVREAFPDCVYLFASEEKSERMLVREWVGQVGEGEYIPPLRKVDEVVEFLLRTVDRVLFIDELQNLERIDPAIISRLQRLIDANPKARLVFAGSYVSVMNRMFTDSKSPLFGRTHLLTKLEELPFGTVMRICRDLGFDDQSAMEFHTIFGGMPKYYELLEILRPKSVSDALGTLFFSDVAPLRNEGSHLLRNEFGGEYRLYFSVMEAISRGKGTLSGIADATGIKPQSISKYITGLKDDFDLISRAVPVTERALTSKKGRYFIRNNFHRFWFRFIHANVTLAESGRWDLLRQMAQEQLPDLVGRSIERVLIDELGSDWPALGPWWNRRGDEIDMVGIDAKGGRALFVEIKWTNRKAGTDVIETLLARSGLVELPSRVGDKEYLVVSRSGFTKRALEMMEDEGVIGWDEKTVMAKLLKGK